MMGQLQMGMFIRNFAIVGGALMISQFGPGPWSRTRSEFSSFLNLLKICESVS